MPSIAAATAVTLGSSWLQLAGLAATVADTATPRRDPAVTPVPGPLLSYCQSRANSLTTGTALAWHCQQGYLVTGTVVRYQPAIIKPAHYTIQSNAIPEVCMTAVQRPRVLSRLSPCLFALRWLPRSRTVSGTMAAQLRCVARPGAAWIAVVLLLLLVPLAASTASTAAATTAGAPPPTPAAHLRLRFDEEYLCTGAVMDLPPRMRLKCRRAPPRVAACTCNQRGVLGFQLACRCTPPLNATGAVVPLAPAMGVIEADTRGGAADTGSDTS